MKKFFLSFFVCIISVCVSLAQSVNDSGAVNKDSGFSLQKPAHKKDLSVKPVEVHLINDSTKFHNDSIQSKTADTIHLKKNALTTPDLLVSFKHVLSKNEWFHFSGTPQAQFMEEHHPKSNEGLFYFFTGIILYFALIKVLFAKYFDNLISLFVRASLRQQQIREQLLQSPLPSLLLNILFIIVGGLYISFLFTYYRVVTGMNHWVLFAGCSTLLFLIYMVKFIVLKLTGWIFNISKATDLYIFVVFMINKIIGILLIPFIVVLSFSERPAQEIVITISFCLIAFLFIYRFIASYPIVRHEIKVSILNFFLYLCAFEIAPLLLIYKVLLTYSEKAF
ncbi:MAG: DUF4271 domain-containing protein [Bacteroidetes bacterium]|nr:DUF4271 domain-containing protein [Bacteroidota bacterium]